MMRWVLASLILAMVTPALAQKAELTPAPFVGCPSDGQQGPIAAPKQATRTPLLTSELADRLAYYQGNDLAVLAPRGWRCIEFSGSNGSILLVTLGPPPKSRDPASKRIGGHFVIVELSLASTSGRFRVAEVAGPLFPVAKKFVDGVKSEPDVKLDFVSIVNDKLTRRSPTVVEFTTPADQDGLGIDSRVLKMYLPISGVAMLTADTDLVMLRTRLPTQQRDLGATIIAQTIAAMSGK